MNQITQFFRNASAEEFIGGLILAALLIRFILNILTDKD